MRTPSRRLASHRNFDDSIGSLQRIGKIDAQPNLDCFTKPGVNLFDRFALSHATGQRWDFSPITPFFSIMNDRFQSHASKITMKFGQVEIVQSGKSFPEPKRANGEKQRAHERENAEVLREIAQVGAAQDDRAQQFDVVGRR